MHLCIKLIIHVTCLFIFQIEMGSLSIEIENVIKKVTVVVFHHCEESIIIVHLIVVTWDINCSVSTLLTGRS